MVRSINVLGRPGSTGKHLIILIAIIGIPPVFAADDSKQLNSDAIAAMRASEFEQAEALFKKALAASQNSADHYDNTVKSNLAVLYRKIGKTDQADVLDKEVATSQGKSTNLSSVEFSNLSTKDCIDFARSQVNRIASAKVCRPVNVVISSAKATLKSDGNASVRILGTSGNQVIQVEMVLAKGPSGLILESSKCDAFVPVEASGMRMSLAANPNSSNDNNNAVNRGSSTVKPVPQQTSAPPQFGGRNISGRLRVLDFSTSWCKWCHKFAPDFQDVASRYGAQADFETLDGDDPNVAPLKAQYGVSGYPTIVFTDSSSQLIDLISGAPSREVFEGKVKSLLGIQ